VSVREPEIPLVDQYYFIAHDDRAGGRRLHPRVVGIGLAAATLGELVMRDRLRIEGGDVYVAFREPLDDPLMDFAMQRLMVQREHHDVRTWLAYFSEAAMDKVIERLQEAGRIYPVRHRRLTGAHIAYQPTDLNLSAWQAVRLERMLNGQERMASNDAFLAGLVAATGLTWHVLWDPNTSAAGLAYLPQVISRLHPSLHELVSFAEAAVGQAVLAPR
jgi:hypothetical protein